MTFWFLHPWIWDIDLFQPACPWWRLWTGRLGGKTAARLLKKLCQRLGRQNIDFFNGTCLPTTYCSALREYGMFVSSFMDMGWVVSASMSVVAAIMDGRAGWENGRAGLCAVGRLLMVGHANLLVNASLASLNLCANPTTRSILEHARQHQPHAGPNRASSIAMNPCKPTRALGETVAKTKQGRWHRTCIPWDLQTHLQHHICMNRGLDFLLSNPMHCCTLSPKPFRLDARRSPIRCTAARYRRSLF